MPILKCLLSLCMVGLLSMTAFAVDNTNLVSTSTSVRSDVVTGNKSVVLCNTATNDMVVTPVAVRVYIVNSFGYHYTGSTCNADSIGSSFHYEYGVYSPEVCTYLADIDNMSFETTRGKDYYYQRDFTELDVILPVGHAGTSYIVYLDETVSDEVTLTSALGVEWSSNCIDPYTPYDLSLVVDIV